MKIEINREEAQMLLDRLAAAPEDEVAERLFNEVTLAMEMEVPEATYPPMVVRDIPNPRLVALEVATKAAEARHRKLREMGYQGPPIMGDEPTANLQPASIAVAQNIAKRVADQMCRAEFDKNDAVQSLEQLVALLETVLEDRQ